MDAPFFTSLVLKDKINLEMSAIHPTLNTLSKEVILEVTISKEEIRRNHLKTPLPVNLCPGPLGGGWSGRSCLGTKLTVLFQLKLCMTLEANSDDTGTNRKLPLISAWN